MARKIDGLFDNDRPEKPLDPLLDFGRFILPSPSGMPASDPRSEPRLPLEEPPMEFDSPLTEGRSKLPAKKRGK